MATVFKIAWRNIWRHPGRSGVLLAAIIAGIWAGVSTSAISNGFIAQRFDRLVEEVSHLQVHHPEFRTERETSMYIPGAGQIIQILRQEEQVSTFSARTLADGMIQSPLTTSGVQIRGVDPEREQETTGIRDQLDDGEYLNTDIRYPLVIGRSLAEHLNIETGMRVVLTFQDVDNELTSAAFTVSGIYSSVSPLEERLVFVRMNDLQEYLAESPIYHEIAVVMEDVEQSEDMTAMLNRTFSASEALTWYELSPELRIYSDLGGQVTYYLMLIILLALAFGILNTMLMAIFERVRELGMLMAIGMNKTRIFTMICLESFLITITGTMGGMALSILFVRYLSREGLDLTAFGEGLAEFGYDAVIYPAISVEEFIGVLLMVMVTAIMSSIYPAIKAIRLQPAVAVRE